MDVSLTALPEDDALVLEMFDDLLCLMRRNAFVDEHLQNLEDGEFVEEFFLPFVFFRHLMRADHDVRKRRGEIRSCSSKVIEHLHSSNLTVSRDRQRQMCS